MPDWTLVGDGPEDQVGHQLDDVARGEMFAGLLVVLLAEAADQLLEDGAHAVVVEPGQAHVAGGVEDRVGAEVDGGVEELVDEIAERVGLDQGRDLVVEAELFEDLLHVFGKTGEVVFEVGAQLLGAGRGR